MKIKVALIAQVIIAIPFGIGFLLIPDFLMSMYIDNPLTPEYIYLSRLYGSKAIGLGLIALLGIWFTELKAKRGIAYGLCFFTLSHCVLFIIGTMQGLLNSLGWLQAGVTAVLTLLYLVALLSKES
jgi:hypothetical protein